MKQNLTVEQSARLIELGVDKKRASKCSSYMKTSASCRGIIQVPQYNPIFTLSDVLEMLPKEKVIEAYNGWEQFFGSKQEDAAQAGRWQLEDIFGSELDFKSLGKDNNS